MRNQPVIYNVYDERVFSSQAKPDVSFTNPITSCACPQQNNNDTCARTCLNCSGNTTNDCLTCPRSYSLEFQTCANITGYIQINNGTFLGYISMDYQPSLGLRGLTQDILDALYGSFNNASSPFDLVMDN